MGKINYKRIPELDYVSEDYHQFTYHLLIDNEIVEDTSVRGSLIKNEGEQREEDFDIESTNVLVSKQLLSYKWTDFPNLSELVLILDIEFTSFERKLYVEKQNDSSFAVLLYFNPKLQSWKRKYSYQEFEQTINEIFKEQNIKYIELQIWNDGDEISIECSTNFFFKDTSLIENLSKFLNECNDLYTTSIEKLETLETESLIFTSFNFPEDIKIPCKQYLEYFARFLKDLGIKTTSSLKEEAGKVLFSVTPTDDAEALDKIREALAVYLKLPSSPIVYDDSFAAMRLKQQVDNLQHAQRMAEMEVRSSQLALRVANQAIEHQDRIIQQKDTTIEQQNKIIERITDKAVMINSAENKEELEKIYEGIEVGESKFIKEQLGIKFNPVKVVKTAVQNTLGKGDEIIELGLNKDE